MDVNQEIIELNKKSSELSMEIRVRQIEKDEIDKRIKAIDGKLTVDIIEEYNKLIGKYVKYKEYDDIINYFKIDSIEETEKYYKINGYCFSIEDDYDGENCMFGTITHLIVYKDGVNPNGFIDELNSYEIISNEEFESIVVNTTLDWINKFGINKNKFVANES
jgi:hypothetical protein